jgi:hypothetical protein
MPYSSATLLWRLSVSFWSQVKHTFTMAFQALYIQWHVGSTQLALAYHIDGTTQCSGYLD